ncbi:hypothetical protein ElyMa_004210200 [Elysia marginata]|uniref:Uncharacterized protein n=1 Tax=Elysia marginata TaxID=1093978 RepID=A0AAV4GN63_9GAST|nr:hypothetical protein ElyMa_004210200 [Elysia marginata]
MPLYKLFWKQPRLACRGIRRRGLKRSFTVSSMCSGPCGCEELFYLDRESLLPGVVTANWTWGHALSPQTWHRSLCPSQEMLTHKASGKCTHNARRNAYIIALQDTHTNRKKEKWWAEKDRK